VPETLIIRNPPFIYISFVKYAEYILFQNVQAAYFYSSVILSDEGIVRIRDYYETYSTEADLSVCDLTRTD
jgi:hypothetical protein